MHHKKLAHMRDTLMCAVETQMCNLEGVDTKELGEAIDMIKDLEEAIYYATVTEAMQEPYEMKKGGHPEGDRMYYDYPMMYSDGRYVVKGEHWDKDMMIDDDEHHDWDKKEDEREGRSHHSRRMYMEAKESKRDKATQLRELEKYMQELSQDIVEMIVDASPEEKQYLEKKITALASKVGQMK